MSFKWTPEEYAAIPLAFQKARTLLEDWFQAIENGTVDQRLPDPICPVHISPDRATRIVELLDEEFDKELSWAKSPEAGEYKAGPGFWRLRMPQRIAMVQQLYSVLAGTKRDMDAVEEEAEPADVYFD